MVSRGGGAVNYAWWSRIEFAPKWSDRISETMTMGVPVRTRPSSSRSSVTRRMVSSMLDENESKLGGVETYADAQKCAALFRSKSEQIDGVLVVLPNVILLNIY